MKSAFKLWMGAALAALIASSATFARPEGDPAPETPKWLTEGAEFVLKLNVKQTFASELVKKNKDELKGLINNNEQAKAVFEATGIDPTKDIDTITLSGTMSSPKDVKALLVVRGKFNLEKIQGAAENFAKKHPDELKLVKSDTLQLYQVKMNEQALVGAFIDSSTLVFTPSKEATLQAVKNVGKRAVKMNKVLQPAIAKFTGKESVALAIVVTDELKKASEKAPQAKEIAPKLQSVTATVTLTDAATTGLTINTDDAATAKKVLMLLKQLQGVGQLLAASDENFGPVASEMLMALKMSTDEKGVSVTLKVTPEMMEKAGKKDKDK